MSMMMFMGLGNNFWRFNNPGQGRAIEDLLEKEGVTLKELLDQEDIIQEMKSGNQKLIDFFNYDVLCSLIQFVTQEPQQDGDLKKCFKYPFTACEIIICEDPRFMENFYRPKEVSTTSFDIQQPQNQKEQINMEEVLNQLNQFDKQLDEVEKQDQPNLDFEDMQTNQEQEIKTTEIKENGGEIQKQPEALRFEYNLQKQSQPTESGPAPIQLLFDFLMTPAVSNSLLCGYFQKIVQSFLLRTTPQMLRFLYQNQNYLKLLCDQLSNKSISDLIQRMISLEETFLQDNLTKNQFLELRESIMDIVLEKLYSGRNSEEVNNASSILIDTIQRVSEICDGASLLRKQQENIERTISCIFELKGECFWQGLPYLQCLFQHYVNTELPRIQQIPPVWINTIPIVESILGDTNEPFMVQMKIQIQPVGWARLKIIQFLGLILKIKDQNLEDMLMQSTIIQQCFNLFFNNFLNNMLHNAVEIIFNEIFSDPQDPNFCNSVQFLQFILEKNELVKRFIQEVNNPDYQQPETKRVYRKSNIGHIVKMCNTLNKCKKIQEFLNQKQEWRDFVGNELKRLNDLDQRNLGGLQVKKPSLDLSIENKENPTSEGYENQQNDLIQKFQIPVKEEKVYDRYGGQEENNEEDFKFENHFTGNEDILDNHFYYTQQMADVDRYYDKEDFVNIGDDTFSKRQMQAIKYSDPVFKSDQEHIKVQQDDRELRDYISSQYWSMPLQNFSNLEDELL